METTKEINTSITKVLIVAFIIFAVGMTVGCYLIQAIVDNGMQENITKITQAKRTIAIYRNDIKAIEKNITTQSGIITKSSDILKTKYKIIFNQ